MKQIDRGEVLGLADYEAIRERFRGRVIAEKKLRRVSVGPYASAVFENRDTVLLQIQEMLRTERITRAQAIQHEIDTYNEQIPGDDELSITLMIEIEDHAEREAFLQAAVGFENHVWLVAGTERVQAHGPARGSEASERTTAVHYLKFALLGEIAAGLRGAVATRDALGLALEIDHPAYAARATLTRETLASLAEDCGDNVSTASVNER
jgi:uncharacterized protein DUF3501